MKILLVCSGGMSSAIVAKALQEAGTKEGLDIQVDECGTQAFAEKVKEDYQISLVAPQIRHRYDVLKLVQMKQAFHAYSLSHKDTLH